MTCYKRNRDALMTSNIFKRGKIVELIYILPSQLLLGMHKIYAI
jgi:hypothetical protein